MSRRARFKVVLLGEGRVGKTSIFYRYIKDNFDDGQASTLEASFLSKRVNINGKTVTLNVWDTAGQERYHSLGPIYYRDADAACLVYDITDLQSFERVKNWVKELRKIVGKNIVIYLAGNKVDLEHKRNVNEKEAKDYAKTIGAKHHGTSAKSGKGIEEIFFNMAKQLLEEKAKGGAGRRGGGGLRIAEDNPVSLKDRKSVV